jgi:hypothetical protein
MFNASLYDGDYSMNATESEMNDNDLEGLFKVFKKAILATYAHGFNKLEYILFTIYLCFLSLIGSLSNLLVITVLHFRDDCMELDGKQHPQQPKKTSSAAPPPPKLMLAKKHNTSSSKPIYLLIHYLAIVDFLTCFIAIPATTVEIWLFTESNEVFCKSFEWLRASGVLLSNFLVILISLERFLLLCQPVFYKKLKRAHFVWLLVAATVLSFSLGTLSMFTLSVYQTTEIGEVFVGVCLPKMNSPANLILALKYLSTSVLILGIFIVKLLYVFIFKKALEVKSKKVDRMMFNDKLKQNAKKHSSLASGGSMQVITANQIVIKETLELADTEKLHDPVTEPCENTGLMKKDESSNNNFLKPIQRNSKFSESKFSVSCGGEEEEGVSLSPAASFSNISSIGVARDGVDEESKKRSRSIAAVLFNRRSLTKHNNSRTFQLFVANIRMALIIFFVTIVYYISVIPWTLTINGVIKYNPFIYYTFFINNAVNPIIYGFFNPNFRRCCIEILGILFNNLKRVVLCRACTEKANEV